MTRPPSQNYRIVKEFKIEGGIVAPQAIIGGNSPRTVIVATGRGELYGSSRVFEFDVETKRIVRRSELLCKNIMAISRVGDALVAACRSSNEVVILDAATLAETQRIGSIADPVSVVAAGSDAFFAANTLGEIRRYERQQDVFVKRLQTRLQSNILGLGYLDGDVYATQPSTGKVARIDGATLLPKYFYPVPGSPSFGVAISDGRLLVSNREGYLHIIRPAENSVENLDLFSILGLDRTTAPERILDVTDIAVAPDQSFVLIANRVNSVLMNRDLSLRGRLPSASRAVASEFLDGFILTKSRQSIIAFAKPTQRQIDLARGHEVLAVAGNDRHHIALMVNGRIAEFVPEPAGLLARSDSADIAAIAGDASTIVAVANNGTISEIGEKAGLQPFKELESISPIFSMSRLGSAWAVVGRLKDRVVLIAKDQKAIVLKPSLARPRRAISIDAANELWVLIHDTHPDVGVSLWKGAQELSSLSEKQFRFGTWVSDAASCGNGTFVIITFDGHWIHFDKQLTPLKRGMIEEKGVDRVHCFDNGRVLMASNASERIVSFDIRAPEVVTKYFVAGLSFMWLQGNKFSNWNHEVWVVTPESTKVLALDF